MMRQFDSLSYTGIPAYLMDFGFGGFLGYGKTMPVGVALDEADASEKIPASRCRQKQAGPHCQGASRNPCCRANAHPPHQYDAQTASSCPGIFLCIRNKRNMNMARIGYARVSCRSVISLLSR